MAVVNKFNVNSEQVTLDADIIENMSANDVPYDSSFQYDENTVGDKLSELEEKVSAVTIKEGNNLFNKAVITAKGLWLDQRTNVIGASDEYASFVIPIDGKSGDNFRARFFGFDTTKLVSSQPLKMGASNSKEIGASVQIQSVYNKDRSYINLTSDCTYIFVTAHFPSAPTEQDKKELADSLVVIKDTEYPTEYSESAKLVVGKDNLSDGLAGELSENTKAIEHINNAIGFKKTEQLFDKLSVETQHFIIDIRSNPAILSEHDEFVSFCIPVDGKSGDVYSCALIGYDTDKLVDKTSQPIRLGSGNGNTIGSQVLQVKITYNNQAEQITFSADAKYLITTFHLKSATEENCEELKNCLVVVKGNEYPSEYLSYINFTVNKINLDDSLRKDIDSASRSRWAGKNIVWYGTSIPCGSANVYVPFEGKCTTSVADHADVRKVFDGTTCSNQYPTMVSSLLGANLTFNEAIGSSRVTPSPTHSNLELRCKALGNSVQDIIGWIEGSYNIDWSNKAYSKNTNNAIGITTWFSDGLSWNMFVWKCFSCIRMSYELALVARYLLSNNSEHDAYVQSIFGSRYNTIRNAVNAEGWDFDGKVGYQSDIDLFVFDHGWNDGIDKYSGNTADATVDTFEGGYNTFFNLIKLYKPNARIVIAGCYTNYKSGEDKISKQIAMAERWQFPFFTANKLLPFVKTFKTTFRGYWDETGTWNDNGFTWSENDSSFTTNNTMFARAINNLVSKPATLANVKELFNPHQVNGVWMWDGYPLCMYMYDGLHPNSDKEGRANKMYAYCLTKWIETL